jgi:AcrR family transcriptional regulator
MARSSAVDRLVESAVLQAARAVFAQRGFNGASVDDVTAEAGLTKGAVYSRFKTKEELFVAAALGRDEETLARIEGRSPREWARAWSRSLSGQRPWNLLALEFRLYGLRHSSVATHVRRWQRQSHARLQDEIERRVADADLRLRVRADDATAIVAAVAAGLAQQQYTDQDIPVERVMRTLLELLVERP